MEKETIEEKRGPTGIDARLITPLATHGIK